jgi:hypothetical protein
VDVDDAPAFELAVDLVEERDELPVARNREVANRRADVSCGRGDELAVRLELALLREVEEEGDPRLEESRDLGGRVVRAPRARMATGDEAVGLDDGGRAHDGAQSAQRVSPQGGYLVRVARLNASEHRADSVVMARLETSTTELRDRALVLSAEHGVDAGAWWLRVLESGREDGREPDLGALVRAYWELQRVTGRVDLRDEWRSLADALWAGETG